MRPPGWRFFLSPAFPDTRVLLFWPYFAISKLISLFLHSFHVPCIIVSNVYFDVVHSIDCMFKYKFQFESSCSHLYVPCFPFFLIDHNQKHVLLIKWVILFLQLKNNFLLHIHNVVSTLINVVKLDVEFKNIVSTLPNAANINVELDVDLTFFNVLNFNIDIHNVVTHVLLTLSDVRTSYHPNNNVEKFPEYWRKLLKDYTILQSLSNWKPIYLAEYLLIAAFVNFRKGIDTAILV